MLFAESLCHIYELICHAEQMTHASHADSIVKHHPWWFPGITTAILLATGATLHDLAFSGVGVALSFYV
jgi:hypothetical protein